ncbi:potassium-transporting ATPase subunit C [Kitasatospora sp. NPDC101157]|uniref:potassium-transporting ATPase subunit C n=1 Tax=Kitasatospora sp. NPDC101157 TaxID=3364098 RepID=UPI00381B46AF
MEETRGEDRVRSRTASCRPAPFVVPPANPVKAPSNTPADTLNQLIGTYTEGRSLGFLGDEGVNVVLLNKAISEQK